MKRGLDWYKREPRAIIDGNRAAKMSTRTWAVFDLLIDLIYEGGGQTPDDPSYIAGHFPDIGTASARREIAHLIDLGKIARDGAFLTNKRAKNQAKTRQNLSETRAKAGQKGGISSGFSRSLSNENNNITEASASSKTEPEKEREKKERDAIASPKKGTRLPADWFLPKEWGEWAVSEGMTLERVRLEAEKFRDHWHSTTRNATKMDWLAAWRNWCRKAMERGPQQRSNGRGQDRFDRRMQFARDLEERRKAERDVADGAGDGSLVPLLPARNFG